jgi:glycerophosphoryl diester phosphodiesterase
MIGRDWRAWRPGEVTALTGVGPVIGHRGAAAHAPENTLAGIRKAHELGCGWIELDVKLSRDGLPFLMHDDRIDRTSSGHGLARAMDLGQLRELDAGSWFGPGFAAERLATLEEAVALILELGLEVNLEIKPCPGREVETARTACRVLQGIWPADRPAPLLSSFETLSLAAARDTAPELPRALLVEALPRRWRELMTELECVSLNLSHRRNPDAVLEELVAEGVPVLLYTVNDPARAQALMRLGATALFTDAPDRIEAALGAAERGG